MPYTLEVSEYANAAVEERNEKARSAQVERRLSANASAFSAKEEKRRQAAERAEQETKAAQKRKNEEVPVPRFETKDAEVGSELRAAYSPQFVRSKRAKDASVASDK